MPGYAKPPSYIADNISFTPGGNIAATNVQDALIEVDAEGGGGATGGGTDEVFFENEQSIDSTYTITSNKNAMSAGPVEIANGVTIEIPSGSVWVVL